MVYYKQEHVDGPPSSFLEDGQREVGREGERVKRRNEEGVVEGEERSRVSRERENNEELKK